MLSHTRRAFSNLGIAVPAQVWEDQPILGIECRRSRIPKFMIAGKRVKKDDRRTISPDFINDFRVVAAQSFHELD